MQQLIGILIVKLRSNKIRKYRGLRVRKLTELSPITELGQKMAYSYNGMHRICNLQLPRWNVNSVDIGQTSYGGRSTANKQDVSTGVL